MRIKDRIGVTAEEFAAVWGLDKTTVFKHMRQGWCPWPRSHQNTGRRNHPLYTTWADMKQRCYNPSNRNYPDYGGRGIKVCARWYIDFTSFIEDMGERPDGHTLDRIDNNGDYSPDNCRWSSRKQQANNRRNGLLLTNPSTGQTKTLAEWAEQFDINERTIRSRYNLLNIRDFDMLFCKDKLPHGSKEARRVVD
jgi:hypothetical protein